MKQPSWTNAVKLQAASCCTLKSDFMPNLATTTSSTRKPPAVALVNPIMQVGQNTWLAYWSQQTSAAVEQHQPLHEGFYLGLYAALAFVAIGLQCIRSYTCGPWRLPGFWASLADVSPLLHVGPAADHTVVGLLTQGSSSGTSV